MTGILTRVFDVRPSERALTATSAALLLLVVSGHTILETARDALFLSRLQPRELNAMYVALAVLSVVVAAATTALSDAVGRRKALTWTLAIAGAITAALYAVPRNAAFAVGFYLYVGVVGSLLVTQFWLVVGQAYSLSQGRRLFGLLSAGGALGGTLGAGLAALVLSFAHTSSLVLVSGGLFFAGAILTSAWKVADEPKPTTAAKAPSSHPGVTRTFTENPLLLRIGALVIVSTASALVIDYLLKSTAAQRIPVHHLGAFFARLYALTNALSFIVQLLVATRLLRGVGVIGALALTPTLLLLGAAGPALTGTLTTVVILKVLDGGLRYSVNRVATELLYLPLPAAARTHGKPYLDSVVSRAAQAATAIALYALAVRGIASTRVLGAIALVLAAAWLASVAASRRGYLDVLRTAVVGGRLRVLDESPGLDMASAETLIEAMASREVDTVVGAMDLLRQKRRDKLIPALILYHESPIVLVRALSLFGDSDRTDWIPLAERLLTNTDDDVRLAAAHTLVRRGVPGIIDRALADPSSRLQAYGALHRALDGGGDPLDDPLIRTLLEVPRPYGPIIRAELISALADSPTPKIKQLLLLLARRLDVLRDASATTNLVRAIVALDDAAFIPVLIEQLPVRASRDAVQDALLHFGDGAIAALTLALEDPSTPRSIRLHVPRALAHFGNQLACDALMIQLEGEAYGLVRFKILRSLGAFVRSRVRFDEPLLERMLRSSLVEHLRLVAIRAALTHGAPPGTTFEVRTLLGSLVDAKADQALERAFRILKLLHRGEDLHGAFNVVHGKSVRERAGALEYVDAMLGRGRLRVHRELLQIALDDIDDKARARRARPHLGVVPRGDAEALAALAREDDAAVATIAGELLAQRPAAVEEPAHAG